MAAHEEAQLDLCRQMVSAGVPVVMAMDNLDAFFHTPDYVKLYSASFYERASDICHDHGAAFLIHACGRQRENLTFVSSLGVDGLEGVAYPPLGDIELDEAMRMTGDRFIITGGISAIETSELKTKDQVYDYARRLFERMMPYANRYILSASCNTPINTRWETIQWFRDAWLRYGAC
jgi:uroporphyrinogen decarboxylase